MVDIDALSHWCAGLGVDVLGLQEVDVGLARSGRVDTVERLAAATGMVAAFGPAFALDGGAYGNALLVRSGLGQVHVDALSTAPGEEPRSLLHAQVDGVRVAVAHLSPRAPGLQLEQALATASAGDGRALFMGDLNLPTAAVARACRTAGFALLGPDDPSYPADDPAVRIDHIAVRGLAPAPTEVLPPAPVSDHRGIVVDLSWRESSPRS